MRGCLFFLSLLSSAKHLRLGNIAFFIYEVEIPFRLLYAAFADNLAAAAFGFASGHLCFDDVTFFVDVIEISLLPLDAALHHLFRHFDSPPFKFKISSCPYPKITHYPLQRRYG